MPINVSGPNGISIEFPDGTDPAIADVMTKQFGSGGQNGRGASRVSNWRVNTA
jgi:hypothetical protein